MITGSALVVHRKNGREVTFLMILIFNHGTTHLMSVPFARFFVEISGRWVHPVPKHDVWERPDYSSDDSIRHALLVAHVQSTLEQANAVSHDHQRVTPRKPQFTA